MIGALACASASNAITDSASGLLEALQCSNSYPSAGRENGHERKDNEGDHR
jgi:hypothetical protein